MAEKNYSPFEMGQKKESKLRHRLYLTFLLVAGLYLYITGIAISDDFVPLRITMFLIDEVVAVSITGLCYYFILIPNVDDLLKKIIISFIIFSITYVSYYCLGDLLLPILKVVISVFTFLNGIISLINLIRQIRVGSNFLWSLFITIMYFGFAFELLFFADLGTSHFFALIGYYLIYSGLYFAREVYYAFRKKKKNVERKINFISLPTIVSAFLPIGFFSNLSKKVNAMEETNDNTLFITKGESQENDLIIYVHTRAGLMPGFGHVDLSLDNKVYCFGNYDQDSWVFGGFFSDGVFLTTSAENHISSALNNDKKVLVAYTLKISDETKEKIKKKIEKIMEPAYRWKPKAELAQEGEIEGNPEDFTDVASLIYSQEQTEFYKFKKGSPYRTYYLLGQNCAMFANDVIKDTGIYLDRLSKLVTPGTYLEFLNALYSMKHTIVVDRKIYMLNDNGKPYLLSKENEARLQEQVTLKKSSD